MRVAGLLLAGFVGFVASGCNDADPTGAGGEEPVPIGQWAGGSATNPIEFIIFRSLADSADFRDNAACVYGEIAEPLRMDGNGRFTAQAQLRRMVGTTASARVEGTLNGNVLLLRLTVNGQTRDYRLLLNGTIPDPRFVC